MPPQLRWRVRALAIFVFVVGVGVWLRSFVASSQTTRFWDVVSFPAFAIVFALWAVTIVDMGMRSRGRPRSDARRFFRLRGWRRIAAAVIFIASWSSGIAVALSGDLDGQPEHRDGRYYSNNHGEITEVTRDEWVRARALDSRLSAGTVMLFAGLAALYLDPKRKVE